MIRGVTHLESHVVFDDDGENGNGRNESLIVKEMKSNQLRRLEVKGYMSTNEIAVFFI